MPKTRIVFNGASYKVQRRGWLFWRDVETGPWYDGFGRVLLPTREQADRLKRECEESDREHGKKWRVVD